MSGGVTATPQSYSLISSPRTPLTIHQNRCCVISRASRDRPLFPSNLRLVSSGCLKFPRINSRCYSTGDSGENESKTILDAFFLGKAVAEALNERIESAVGEFLSTIGRLQAEQQKQVQEFQDDVLEKARRAKEQAAKEAMGGQGLVSRSTAADINTPNGVGAPSSFPSDSTTTAGSSSRINSTSENPSLGNTAEE